MKMLLSPGRLAGNLLFCWLLLASVLEVRADGLDSVALRLSTLGGEQVQEKIYVHTDNECYFVGDTLWYKAYVLRADNLHQTDMSRMAYVELLSPDGLVVERQCIVVGKGGYACGQFALTDSLYSGFYELRAYTRWMLNFNVSEREHASFDRYLFYNNAMCKDFFRDWDGLFSRVIPVYSKPVEEGDWGGKYMYGRPKQEIARPPKEELIVDFYPEGGALVEGLKSRVAFEIRDEYGERFDLEGQLDDGTKVKVMREGRGVFDYLPTKKRGQLTFEWKGKTRSFDLPKAREHGLVLTLSSQSPSSSSVWTASLSHSADMEGQPVGVAVLCRGRLVSFEKVTLNGGRREVALPKDLPTGVNDVQIVDAEGNTLASRLIFVNGENRALPVNVDLGGKTDFMPYEKIGVTVKSEGTEEEKLSVSFSLSVHDAQTDEATYADGDMLSEMLLTSDLKGFVAHPAYYFERDDAEHRAALDLLMMVQGWRRYKAVEQLRYTPEVTLTVEGSVNKMLSVPLLLLTDVEGLNARQSVAEEMMEMMETIQGAQSVDSAQGDDAAEKESSEPVFEGDEVWDGELGVNHGSLRKEVLVEAEVTTGTETAGVVQKTHDGGRFLFQIPPFYGKAILFMKAYHEKDSVKRNMMSRKDKKVMDEESYPDFYVKRDLFYPVFSHPYDFYQTHQPVNDSRFIPSDNEELEKKPTSSKLEGDHTLETVNVEARRRGRRGIDFTKPAFVIDAYDLYNEATDRGLSWGVVNMGTFPPIACYTVYGNMNRYNSYNVRANLDDGYTFYKNYQGMLPEVKHRSTAFVFDALHLRRIQNFRFYTDYEPRNADQRLSESENRDDITLVYEAVADDGKRYTYRDRRYVFDGFAYPEDFYKPDYSKQQPPVPTDYRRTLYWNPNARLDADGTFHIDFYNNSRETRVAVSVAGMTEDGKFLRYVK